jgi:hypothetical protein
MLSARAHVLELPQKMQYEAAMYAAVNGVEIPSGGRTAA